jgi:DNA-binding NtrC family response regulator
VRTKTRHSFLIVGDVSDLSGLQALQDALSALGHTIIASEGNLESHLEEESYAAAVVDAGAVSDPEDLVRKILSVHPHAQVVVITASPHWKIARAVFRAGATDYLRKSQNVQEIRAAFAQMLNLPVPDTPSKDL